MRLDTRLSRVLHVLIHMGNSDEPLTSEVLAKMLQTNSVVVRRTLGELRQAGYVKSSKGHGGGWELSKSLKEISFLDIYEALNRPQLFALGLSTESSKCAIENSVNHNLSQAFSSAEDIILKRFKKLTLSEIAKDLPHKSFASHR